MPPSLLTIQASLRHHLRSPLAANHLGYAALACLRVGAASSWPSFSLRSPRTISKRSRTSLLAPQTLAACSVSFLWSDCYHGAARLGGGGGMLAKALTAWW